MQPIGIEQSLRLFFQFAEHLYAEDLALRQLAEEAGIDWKRRILPALVGTKEKAERRFQRLYIAGADLDALHDELQRFLGIRHG